MVGKMGRFDDRIIIVTGGAGGIGEATAMAFGKEGAKVVVSDVNVKAGEEAVRTIKEAGGEAVFVRADVSKSLDVEVMVRKTVESYGRLDYAFNNAGIGGGYAPIVDVTEENWDKVMSVNLKGVWLCMKYEIPQMVKQGYGVIVNTSSMAGIADGGYTPDYAVSKAGVIRLTRTAARVYRDKGVRVNAVCPGLIRTPLLDWLENAMPSGKDVMRGFKSKGLVGEPQDIAEAVVWLCSDSARFVNGHALVIDGGYTL